MNKNEIENIFTSSSSSDEIFDAFHEAITQKIADINLYKILLANAFLKEDEAKLYASKIGKEFPEFAYDIYMWCAEIFANKSWYPEQTEHAIECLLKAFDSNKKAHEPLVKLLELYNHELDMSANKSILEGIKKRYWQVENKAAMFSAIAKFYGKANKEKLKKKYEMLAQKYKR